MGSVKSKCLECRRPMVKKAHNQKYHPSCAKKVYKRLSYEHYVRIGHIKKPGVGSGNNPLGATPVSERRAKCPECKKVMIKKTHTQKYHPSCAEKVDARNAYETKIRLGLNKNPGMGGGFYKPRPAKCTECGKEMTKKTARHKYCASCQKEMGTRRSYGYAVQAGRIKNPGRGSWRLNENSSNWKYGARPWQVKNFRGTKCERCGTDKGKMHLHHKDQDGTNWKPENLETLCGDKCHPKEHAKDAEIWGSQSSYPRS